MTRTCLALACIALLAAACGKSDESLCDSALDLCPEGAVRDAMRSTCLQTLDSKSCGNAARDFFECADDNKVSCDNGSVQTKSNSCLSELGAYIECTSKSPQ